MGKRLIQFVFQINQESLQHFEILLKEILPQSLREGTLKQFHYQYDPNNTNCTLLQTSITQFKKLLYSNYFDEEDTWFFYCQNKKAYFECIKINSILYISVIMEEFLYTKHKSSIESRLQTITTFIHTENYFTEYEANEFIDEHYSFLILSPLTQSQLCTTLNNHYIFTNNKQQAESTTIIF